MKKCPYLNQERNMLRSSTVYKRKKKQSYIKLLVFFDMKGQQGMDFFIGGNNVNYGGSGLKLTP